MMTEPSCASCRWWLCQIAPIARAAPKLDPSLGEDEGSCHGSPPIPLTVFVGPTPTIASVFPVTRADRCCAMWEDRLDYDPDDGEQAAPPAPAEPVAKVDTVVPFRPAA